MRRKRNPGWFRCGHDPRRHQLTAEERRRGGNTTARMYTIVGPWPPDWHEQATRRTTTTQDKRQ
ncbi:MAG TPA: hypothetical protein VM529_24855 [Gemmata sp.]|jgi:hypothetical protein|nr:hypothetical protein [Gemmata sp.]